MPGLVFVVDLFVFGVYNIGLSSVISLSPLELPCISKIYKISWIIQVQQTDIKVVVVVTPSQAALTLRTVMVNTITNR